MADYVVGLMVMESESDQLSFGRPLPENGRALLRVGRPSPENNRRSRVHRKQCGTTRLKYYNKVSSTLDYVIKLRNQINNNNNYYYYYYH